MDAHPTTYSVTPQAETRNRLTVGFRFILAIPHLLLVGGPGSASGGGDRTGVLGTVAGVAAFINWFIIVFTGKANKDLMSLQQFYLRWRARALAYEALLRDEYPPFGDGDYPVEAEFPGRHRRIGIAGPSASASSSIIPQIIVLLFVFDRLGDHGDNRLVRGPVHRPLSRRSVEVRRRRDALVTARRVLLPATARRLPAVQPRIGPPTARGRSARAPACGPAPRSTARRGRSRRGR